MECVYLVEERGAHRDLLARKSLGYKRKKRAPEHGKQNAEKNPVVEQESRFARGKGLESIFGLQLWKAQIE